MEGAQLADTLQATRLRQQLLQARQSEIDKQRAFDETVQSVGGDHTKVADALKKRGLHAEAWEFQNRIEKATADTDRTRHESLVRQQAELDATEKAEDDRRMKVYGILDAYNTPELYPSALEQVKALGPKYSTIHSLLPKAYDKAWMNATMREAIPFLDRVKARNEQNKPVAVPSTSRLAAPDPADLTKWREVLPAASTPSGDAYGVPAGYVSAYRAEKQLAPDAPLSLAQIEDMNKKYAASRRDPSSGSSRQTADPKTVSNIVKGIEEGTLPPVVQGLYSNTDDVLSGLVERNVNLAQRRQEWEATRKFMSAPFNPQQLRVRQAAETAYHSLDVIDAVAKAWDAGQFPALNRARMALATSGGVGGSVRATLPVVNPQTGRIEPTSKVWTASELARILDAQISDITSEMANVYMGGNSPTDHAMELASKNLSGDWSRQDLVTMVNQGRTNLRYRLNAMDSVLGDLADTYMPQRRYVPQAAQSTEPSVAPQGLQEYLPTLQWTEGQGQRIRGADGTDYGVWTRQPDGTYQKVAD